MRVLKFGGAALADGPAVLRAARIVEEHGGERPLVVVSAHQGVTRLLAQALQAAEEGRLEWDVVRVRHRTILRQLALPGDLLDRHLAELRTFLELLRTARRLERRTRDFVLSFGERMSARVFAALLRRQGTPATPLDAWDLGLVLAGESLAGPAPERLLHSLRAVPGVPVVTGFLALDEGGHLATLGRSGSDLSAVWLAEAVGAREVHLWKTVPGVLTADPELVREARLVPELSWSDAEELAGHGSQVLHPAALQPARRAKIAVLLRPVEEPAARGTRVQGDACSPRPVAIAHRPALTRLSLPPGPRPLARALEILAGEGLAAYVAWSGPRASELFVPEEPASERFGSETFGGSLERGLASAALVSGEASAAREAIDAGALRLPRSAAGRARVWIVRAGELPELVRRLHARVFEHDLARPSGRG